MKIAVTVTLVHPSEANAFSFPWLSVLGRLPQLHQAADLSNQGNPLAVAGVEKTPLSMMIYCHFSSQISNG